MMKNIIFSSRSYDRKGRVVEAVEHHNSILDPALRAEKFKRMKASPYAFFRGSNHLFWSDFAGDWTLHAFGGSAFSRTWLEGDAHVYNMGAYLNNAGNIAFGFDDYDDSLVADYQYDIWRFAVSIVLDAWQNERFGASDVAAAVRTFAKRYLKTMASFERVDLVSCSFDQSNTCKPLAGFLNKTAKKCSRRRMLQKSSVVGADGARRFQAVDGKLAPVQGEVRDALLRAYQQYLATIPSELSAGSELQDQVLDVAERLGAGTGSLGLKRYYLLISGQTDQAFDDIILDVKQQHQPTAFSYLSEEERREYDYNFENHAQRHAEACRALSEFPDPHLGWLAMDDTWFSVRERSPFKNDFPTDKLTTAKGYRQMAKQWAEIIATKHLRAARRLNQDLDPRVFESTMNRILRDREQEFSAFVDGIAQTYAQQVRMDWMSFRDEF